MAKVKTVSPSRKLTVPATLSPFDVADAMEDDALAVCDLSRALFMMALSLENEDCTAVQRIAEAIEARGLAISGRQNILFNLLHTHSRVDAHATAGR